MPLYFRRETEKAWIIERLVAHILDKHTTEKANSSRRALHRIDYAGCETIFAAWYIMPIVSLREFPEPIMSVLSRTVARYLRLAIAPIKGFFSFKTETKMPSYDPDRTTLWAHLKEVARRDTILYFEPFKFAVRAFKQELARPY